MQVPFSLYDLLGYMLPGAAVVIIICILINPSILEHPLSDTKDGLGSYVPTTGIQGIFYAFVFYFVGYVLRACREIISKFGSKWKWLRKLDIDNGKFMEELLNPDCGGSPLYSKHFVYEFRNQIEEIFRIKVDKIEQDREYREIFNFCRMVLIRQSPATYSRVLVLFSRYGSARAMVYVFLIATLGFLGRGILEYAYEAGNWRLISSAVISFLLSQLFLGMYKKHLENYRSTILYGFYEHAVTREKS